MLRERWSLVVRRVSPSWPLSRSWAAWQPWYSYICMMNNNNNIFWWISYFNRLCGVTLWTRWKIRITQDIWFRECEIIEGLSPLTSREVWSEEKAIKQRPSGENFLRKQGGFSTLTTVKLGNRFWWKQRTRYQWAPGRPEQILRFSRRWTTFWFWMRLGFKVGKSSSIVVWLSNPLTVVSWVVSSYR